MKKIIAGVFFFFLLVPFYGQSQEKFKDVILVLDISLSMIGKDVDARDIFEPTRKQVIDTIRQLDLGNNNDNSGDTVTIISYGAFVRQSDRIFLRNEKDREEVIKYVEELRANSLWTNTSLMLNNLSKTLQDLHKENPDRIQVSFIFSDAKDSPSPGAQSLELEQTKAERCIPLRNKQQFVYYFAITPEKNDAIVNQVIKCFPDLLYSSTDNPQRQIKLWREQALNNTIPKIEVSSAQLSYKPRPGKSLTGSIIVVANRLAEGMTITPELIFKDENISKIEFLEKSIELIKGENKIDYHLSLGLRAEEKAYFSMAPLSKSERENLFFYPQNAEKFDITISIAPFTFSEKLMALPEYYIPAILLILLILFLFYKLYKYLTFVPILVLSYWETPKDGDLRERDKAKIRSKAKRAAGKNVPVPDDEELFANYPEPLKEEINFMEIEESDYFIACEGDPKKEFEPQLILPALKKGEIIRLQKTGTSGKSLLKPVGKWKMRIRRKEKFGGRAFRNGCYFTYGKYSFEVKTNLR